MRLDSHLRRLTTYLYVQDLLRGTVLEIGELGDGARAGERKKLLDELLGGQAGARLLQCQQIEQVKEAAGSVDVVLAVDVAPEAVEKVATEARRLLSADGVLVLGCESRDRPGATRGLSYYDLADRLESRFPAVTLVGQAPFLGATMVEYGLKDPEPILDGTLVERGERVEWYLAVAGEKRRSAGGYSVVQVPLAQAGRPEAAAPAARQVSAPAPATPRKETAVPASALDLAEQLRAREKGMEELKSAAIAHAEEMTKVRAELRERDALIRELEESGREAASLKNAAERAEKRAQAAESGERKARLALADTEGRLVRAANGAMPLAPVLGASLAASAPAQSGDAGARLAALEAENAKLKQKEEDARAEAWKHLKARSEAEAQAAEVREDTVRKLKDARKLANVELTRAMEEAAKKAVSLKDELARTERERKALFVEAGQLREALAQAQAAAPVKSEPERPPAQPIELARAREEGDAAVLAVRARLERELRESEDERQRLTRLYAEVEREMERRGEAAGRMRQSLREREREVEALRREIAERDARLNALERGRTADPEEAARLETELGRARLRQSELEGELERKEMLVERAAAAAGHERARAERLIAEERRAIGERNEARARAAEAEARAVAMAGENQRLLLERGEEEEMRARLSEMEAELRGEEQRIARVEEALKRAQDGAGE